MPAQDLNAPAARATPQVIVWWILWATMLAGVILIFFFLARSPVGEGLATTDSPVWLIGLAPLVVSTVIRWLIFPTITNPQTALVLFVIGISLSEAACILGVFVWPAYQQELFALSVLGILQYMPVFARKFSRA